MTLQHSNRVRKCGGKQVIRELELAGLVEISGDGPTEGQFRQRGHEIHLQRARPRRNRMVDWLQADSELGGHRAEEASQQGL